MFATNTFAQWTNSSDANFRIWGSGFAAQLLASGLVQTSDTGQINWTTVTAPAGTATFPGYEIWRFNDALQSTAPVFVKFEYGSGSSSANNPAIRFQFGSGSNGSGTLTGSTSTVATTMATANAGTVTNWWSGGTARFCCVIGTTGGSLNAPLTFGMERSKDANGNDTTEAVLLVYKQTIGAGSSTAFAQFAWDTATGMKSAIEASNGLSILLPSVGTGVTGTQVATYPIFHTKGIFMNPGLNFLGYYTADLVAASTPAIPIYGSNHTYFAVAGTNVSGVVNRATSSSNGLLMRYE